MTQNCDNVNTPYFTSALSKPPPRRCRSGALSKKKGSHARKANMGKEASNCRCEPFCLGVFHLLNVNCHVIFSGYVIIITMKEDRYNNAFVNPMPTVVLQVPHLCRSPCGRRCRCPSRRASRNYCDRRETPDGLSTRRERRTYFGLSLARATSE